MKTRFYKALWGMEGSLQSQLDRIAEAGYDGVETPLPGIWGGPDTPESFRREAEARGLAVIVQIYPVTVEECADGLARAANGGISTVNLHSGKDWQSFDDGCRFFEAALECAAKERVTAFHETHRGRLLFCPAVTAAYLQRFPDLRITADFSHFTVVCESLLGDQLEAVELACARTGHVHARVGYEQGPQVPDFRAPEYQRCTERFEQFWDRMRAHALARGDEELTVTPEFGPPDYMHTQPWTRMPVADLWEICLAMRDHLKARWAD